MPHLIVDHSANVADTHDMGTFCTTLWEGAAATGHFKDTSAIKVRCLPCAHWHIGTQPQSFVHVTVRILEGRSPETRADLSAQILALLETALPDVGTISVDIREFEKASYVKRTLP